MVRAAPRTCFPYVVTLGVLTVLSPYLLRGPEHKWLRNDAMLRRAEKPVTPAPTLSPLVIVAKPPPPVAKPPVAEAPEALLFTMDAAVGYEARAKKGGASGEITVRKALSRGLEELGVKVVVADSDEAFESLCCDSAILILDAWTWAAPGWKPKPKLVGREGKIFLLDFFGAPSPRNFNVPSSRILTAYPTYPGNSFLGFVQVPGERQRKEAYGVVWGKDPKHFQGKAKLLKAVARLAPLHATLSPPPDLRNVHNITFHGHLSKSEWAHLLGRARFVLGLGDPLLGPSALDAVAHGCVYVDPAYPKPVKDVYHSQHPYLRSVIGHPYVCDAKLDDVPSYVACVQQALRGPDLAPVVPDDFTPEAYRNRLRTIFDEFLPERRPRFERRPEGGPIVVVVPPAKQA